MRMAGEFISPARSRSAWRFSGSRSVRAHAARSATRAGVFFGSIIYLPLLWILMIADKSDVTVSDLPGPQRNAQRDVRRPALTGCDPDPARPLDRAAPRRS